MSGVTWVRRGRRCCPRVLCTGATAASRRGIRLPFQKTIVGQFFHWRRAMRRCPHCQEKAFPDHKQGRKTIWVCSNPICNARFRGPVTFREPDPPLGETVIFDFSGKEPLVRKGPTYGTPPQG